MQSRSYIVFFLGGDYAISYPQFGCHRGQGTIGKGHCGVEGNHLSGWENKCGLADALKIRVSTLPRIC